MNNQLISNLREDYRARTLEITDVATDPIQQFEIWFKEALDSAIKEANAMTLATVNAKGQPSARIVLLKGFDKKGFVFYTNYNSKKGIELAQNPNVALVFLWKELERQVRIEGVVKKSSVRQSTTYFHSRPQGSQIGAWASPQSQVIKSRVELENNYKELKEKYKNKPTLPKPSNWGGYLVQPTLIEFWQGRSSRLHDRICYTLQEKKKWSIERLAP